jgi:hypothetical protein
MKRVDLDLNMDTVLHKLEPIQKRLQPVQEAVQQTGWYKHFTTVNHHRRLVQEYCFRVGLYRQGLLHDLSKYSPVEFSVGAKYYQGFQSPNNAERMDRGYSSAWLHHKGRNKHHLEYWIDYSLGEESPLTGMEMPKQYVVEMFCDRVAASKTYRGENYKDSDPWEYYEHSKSHYLMHPNTRDLLESMLKKLAEEGEDAAFAYIRTEILGK